MSFVFFVLFFTNSRERDRNRFQYQPSSLSFVPVQRQFVIISFCFKVPFREPNLIIKSLMCSILAEMTCETWKVNINFIVLSSNNDGFCAGMAVSSFVCSLAHIFIYILFLMYEVSRDMASRMLFGRRQYPVGMMEG